MRGGKSQYSPRANGKEKALWEGLLLVVSKWTEGSCFGLGRLIDDAPGRGGGPGGVKINATDYHEFIIALLYCDNWIYGRFRCHLSSFWLAYLIVFFPPASIDHAAISQRQTSSPLPDVRGPYLRRSNGPLARGILRRSDGKR